MVSCLESHGLFTWGDTAKDCYDCTIDVINVATGWLAARAGDVPAFGGAVHESLSPNDRRAIAARLMPAIRGFVSGNQHMVGHFNDEDAVLEFVNAKNMVPLAALGTSCPDHFLRTKIRPLVVGFDPANGNIDEVLEGLPAQVASYREDYAAYYERCKHDNSPALRDPNAVGLSDPGRRHDHLCQGQGDCAHFRRVLRERDQCDARRASAVSEYCGLPEQEAFDIEYWLLEEAKLQGCEASVAHT